MKKIYLICFLVVIQLHLGSCQSPTSISSKDAESSEIVQANNTGHAKNIILLIGDGMGLTQVQAAMTVNNNHLNIERCENIGLSKTSSSSDYITDSAAGGTAMSCGVKTYNGAIGVDPSGNTLKSILEYAEDAGLATGLVATSTITHATPASFIAHDDSRQHYEAIAKDFLDVDVDVFIGGGLNNFTKRVDGLNLVDSLKQHGYNIALNMEDLATVKSGKIAGLLNDEAMPTMQDGRGDMLLKSSKKAIEILSQNNKGFFLMIEGSQIDWGGHSNDIQYVVSELLDFDSVVGMALDFAAQDGETMVIVTADHETGGLSILGKDIMNDPTATNFSTKHHTSVMVPVYSSGPDADNFKGIYENNTLFNKMMAAIGIQH